MRGRIRTVKPELFKSEKLWDLQVESGLPVTQGFIGLWCYADREGRFEWKPRALKSDILPYWDGDMGALLEALASKLFVVRYTVDGKDYGYIRSWSEHQKPDHREAASVLPSPEAHGVTGNPLGMPRETPEATPLSPGGMEWKGMEGEWKGTDLRAPADMSVIHPVIRKIQEDWIPSPELIASVVLAGCPRDVFDRRLVELRRGPIGGARGIFPNELDGYVLDCSVKWKLWNDAERAKAQMTPGRAGFARGSPVPTWEPNAKHAAFASQRGLSLGPLVEDFTRRGYTRENYPEKDLNERFGNLLSAESKKGKATNVST